MLEWLRQNYQTAVMTPVKLWLLLSALLLSPVSVWGQTTVCSSTIGVNVDANSGNVFDTSGHAIGNSIPSLVGSPLFVDTVHLYCSSASTNAWVAIYDAGTLIGSSAQVAVVSGWNKITLSSLVGLYKTNNENYYVMAQFQDGSTPYINAGAGGYLYAYKALAYSSAPPASFSFGGTLGYAAGIFADYCGVYPA